MLAFMFFGLEIVLGHLIMAGLATAGTIMLQRQQVKSTTSRQRKEQEAAAKAQAEQAGKQRAIANAPISPEQMRMVIGQRQIDNLISKFSEQDQTEPEIYTLPAAEPTSPIERINRAIGDLFI